VRRGSILSALQPSTTAPPSELRDAKNEHFRVSARPSNRTCPGAAITAAKRTGSVGIRRTEKLEATKLPQHPLPQRQLIYRTRRYGGSSEVVSGPLGGPQSGVGPNTSLYSRYYCIRTNFREGSKKAKPVYPNLSEADLHEANLHEANLRHADDLQKANLQEANLSGAEVAARQLNVARTLAGGYYA